MAPPLHDPRLFVRSSPLNRALGVLGALEALQALRDGRARVCVATDVAARGLDIEDLPSVINFELPHTAEDYVHRIGRTGRAGRNGEACSLVSSDEKDLLRDIQRVIKMNIPVLDNAGYPSFGPAPIQAERPPRPPQRNNHRRGSR